MLERGRDQAYGAFSVVVKARGVQALVETRDQNLLLFCLQLIQSGQAKDQWNLLSGCSEGKSTKIKVLTTESWNVASGLTFQRW